MADLTRRALFAGAAGVVVAAHLPAAKAARVVSSTGWSYDPAVLAADALEFQGLGASLKRVIYGMCLEMERAEQAWIDEIFHGSDREPQPFEGMKTVEACPV